MRRPTIRVQLLVLALAAIVPVAGAVIYAVISTTRASLVQAEGEMANLAATTANALSERLRENEQLLSRLAQRPLIKAMDPRRYDPVAADLAKLHPDYFNLAVRDALGNRVCSVLPVPPAVVVTRFPWVLEVLRGEGLVAGDAVQDQVLKRWFS